MVAGLPGIVAAYTVTGDADALLHIKTASPAELEAVVEQVRAHQNAERTKTTIVLVARRQRLTARRGGAACARSTARGSTRELDARRRR